jgi:hypothetical protein
MDSCPSNLSACDADVRAREFDGAGVTQSVDKSSGTGWASGPARLNARLIRDRSVPCETRSPSRPTKSGERVGHCVRSVLLRPYAINGLFNFKRAVVISLS